MDELEQLREFRSDVPQHDVDLSRAQSALDEAIEAETSRAGKPRARGSRLFPRPRFALGGAAAALAAVVLAIAFLPADRGGPNAAVAALERVAVVAGDQLPESPPGPGQYLYTKSLTLEGVTQAPAGEPRHDDERTGSFADNPFENPDRTLDEVGWIGAPKYTVELWISPQGTGRVLARLVDFNAVPGVEVRDNIRRMYEELDSEMLDYEITSETPMVFRDLSGLPTDPAALHGLIEDGKVHSPIMHRGEGAVRTYSVVADLLGTPATYAPPEIREALYNVVAELPDVELIGDGVTDPAHRSGVAVALTSNGIRRELIFDPSTAVLLAQRDVLTDPGVQNVDVPQGTVIGYTVYLTSGVVDSTRETLGPNPPYAPPPPAVPPGVEPPPR